MSTYKNQSSAPLSEDIKEYLNIFKQSKTFILFVLAAVFISYCSTSIEEKKLLCSISNSSSSTANSNENNSNNTNKCCENLPDTCPMKLTSSLIVFWALIYFYILSLDVATTPAEDCMTQYLNCLNYDAALLVLVAGGIRLYIAFKKCFG